MRTVLYTEDMEPITVMELQPWAMEYLQKNGRVYFAVHRPMSVQALTAADFDRVPDCTVWQVCIRAEVFIRRGVEHMFLFTSDEEQALLLKSAFLPGQWGEVRERERQAWGKGFMDALNFAARS